MARHTVEVLWQLTDDISGEMSRISENVGKVNTDLLKAAAPLAAFSAAVTAGFAVAIDAGSAFEYSMRNVQAVSGATGEEYERLSGFAKEMGRTTVFSASESADALYKLASAGMEVEEQIGSLKGILDLAAATQADLASSSELVVGAIRAYGLAATESEQISNVFAAAIGKSQLNMERLGAALPYVMASGDALNISLEEMVAALGQVVDRSVPAATAGAGLRIALSRLAKGGSEVEAALSSMGLTIDQVNPATRSLTEIVAALETGTLGVAEASALFGERGMIPMLALVKGGSAELAKMTGEITGTDAAARMAAIQLDSWVGVQKLLNSAIEAMKITVFEALRDDLVALGRVLISVVSGIVGFAEEHKTLTKIIVTVVATLAGASGLAAALLGIVAIAPLVGTAITVMTGPIGIVTMVIAAAIAIGWRFRHEIAEAFVKAAEVVLSAVENMLTGVADFLSFFGADWLDGAVTAIQNARAELQALDDRMDETGESAEELYFCTKDAAEGLDNVATGAGAAASQLDLVLAKIEEIKKSEADQVIADLAKALYAGQTGMPGIVTPETEPESPRMMAPEPDAVAESLGETATLIDSFMVDLREQYGSVGGFIDETFDAATASVGQAFVGVIMQGKSFGDAMSNVFRSMAAAILTELGKVIAKLIFALTLQRLLGGVFGIGFEQGGLIPAIPGFATGGMLFGSPGRDKTVFRGTAGEYVVSKPIVDEVRRGSGQPPSLGGGQGGVTNVFNISTFDSQDLGYYFEYGAGKEAARDAGLMPFGVD